jgi:hypothetical protein
MPLPNLTAFLCLFRKDGELRKTAEEDFSYVREYKRDAKEERRGMSDAGHSSKIPIQIQITVNAASLHSFKLQLNPRRKQ